MAVFILDLPNWKSANLILRVVSYVVQLIAVCSEDGSVQVFEEQSAYDSHLIPFPPPNAPICELHGRTETVVSRLYVPSCWLVADVGGGLDDRNANASSKWVNRAVLKDSSRAVTDIEFAPRYGNQDSYKLHEPSSQLMALTTPVCL